MHRTFNYFQSTPQDDLNIQPNFSVSQIRAVATTEPDSVQGIEGIIKRGPLYRDRNIREEQIYSNVRNDFNQCVKTVMT